ncbi:hypothetical protein E2C01_024173 [Portunus trituberculatus]|uniref:Uncharacterized protein n=1 Tax=Portunus trituberculatus TaxID=210409 RepID=A0A5B7E9V5_PORTR|nr:hypothetical protein [Portunus trituberculatus]
MSVFGWNLEFVLLPDDDDEASVGLSLDALVWLLESKPGSAQRRGANGTLYHVLKAITGRSGPLKVGRAAAKQSVGGRCRRRVMRS